MKVVKRVSLLLLYSLFVLLYLYVSTSLILFKGPFTALRKYVIDSIATTRHGYLLRPMSLYIVSKAEIAANSAQLTNLNSPAGPMTTFDYSKITDESIRVLSLKEPTFTASVMLVRNPERVKVAVTRYLGTTGETVSQMVSDAKAIAGINGGAFEDTGYRGTGGIPLGITMHNGTLVRNDLSKWSSQPVIGMTKQGQLVAGAYTLHELQTLHVTEAVAFGPVLVQDGKGQVQGEGGWGYAPRTAIGQTANGTIIFMVTDGRFVHGANDLGASLKEIQDLMLQNGAVTAANLDGGSSTTMVYNGQLVNQPTDVLGARQVATSFVVMPKAGE
jgi:exopolysaccharide biosynthesis protein